MKVKSLKTDLKNNYFSRRVYFADFEFSLIRLNFDCEEKRRYYGFSKLVSFGQGSNFSKKRKDDNTIIRCLKIPFGQGLRPCPNIYFVTS